MSGLRTKVGSVNPAKWVCTGSRAVGNLILNAGSRQVYRETAATTSHSYQAVFCRMYLETRVVGNL